MEKINISSLVAIAKEAGFSGAELMAASDVVLSREFRDACAANRCGVYGKCYMCPPDVGDIDTLMEKVHGFSHALLLQTISPLEDSYDFEGMQDARKNHANCMQSFWKQIRTAMPEDTLALSVGGCGVCKVCAKVTDEPCRFPKEALSSLEAYGVHVSMTASKTSLKYINGHNTVTYFGMLLFNG